MSTLRFFIAAIAVVLLSPLSSAQTGDADLASRVADLKAMSSADRRAALKGMSQEERRGLWFELKKSEWEEKNVEAAQKGFYRDAVARPAADTAGNARNASTRAVGSITYDDGVITTSFGGGAIIGNRFNTHTGVPVLASGTVSTVVGVVIPGPAQTTNSAGFVIEGPQTVSGGAFAIFSSFTTASGATDTVTFSGIGANYTGSSFFVLFGDFANSYVPAFGTGTTNGQGHHGVVGYTGGMGPNITSTFDFGGTLNGLVRAGGNILPVELMKYGVE